MFRASLMSRTSCGMFFDFLSKAHKGPILVVDADANSNLNEVLGVEAGVTLGQIREEMAQAELKGTIPANMTKADYAEFKFSSALIEEDDFDMLVMGRTQGKGCYCYVNGVLKAQVDKYAKNYSYVVMDNEAGLEHVARGTLPHVDTMLLISDCSRRGVQAVARSAEWRTEMHLRPARRRPPPRGTRPPARGRCLRPPAHSGRARQAPCGTHATLPARSSAPCRRAWQSLISVPLRFRRYLRSPRTPCPAWP